MSLPIRQLRQIIEIALAEDAGQGDVTTAGIVDPQKQGWAVILAKESGVIAGLPVARETFAAIDAGLQFTAVVGEGGTVKPGTRLADIKGRLASILTAERVALNLMQRMSGTATLTAQFVKAVEGTGAQIVDTRKTAPGLRLLDKHAVKMGGGRNHRFNLSDGILIKDNHIAAAGGIAPAVEKMRKSAHHLLKIEIEARTVAEVKEALAAGVEAILLDNMEPETIQECVKMIGDRALVEASGGVTLRNVRAIAETGVAFISVGEITHSAPVLDLCLEIVGEREQSPAPKTSL